MNAAVYYETGDPDVFRYEEVPDPVCPPDGVRIDVKVVSVEGGDVAYIHATGGRFLVEDLEREAPRAATFEISATGPIFGSRILEPQHGAAARERAALRQYSVSLEALRPLRGIKVRGTRRALRVRPEDVAVEAAPDGMELRFSLPPGSYATVLVEELLGPDRLPS